MSRSRPLLLALVAGLALLLGVVLLRGPGRAPVPASRQAADLPVERPAVELLRGWDEQRAAAWAAGSPRLLRDLYVADSAAGRSDVRLLRAYVARGYRVDGLRTQLLALRVLERRADRVRLDVTDRLAAAVAVGPRGRVVLPRDRAGRHRVTLVRGGDGAWRVAAVVSVS